MMYDKERIYATKWQHVIETAVNDCRRDTIRDCRRDTAREIVESFLKENCLTIAQIAKGCGLEIEEVEAISRQLDDV